MKWVLGLVLAALIAGPVAAAPPPVRIEAIQVRLLVETTGELSPNVAPPETFSGWNTIIGSEYGGPASDILVSVVLKSVDEQENARLPLVITVRTKAGKILARRTIPGVFLDKHTAVRSVLVPDATCEGEVTVVAVMGAQRKTNTIVMNCGE